MIDSINILSSAFSNLKKYSNSSFVIYCNGEILRDNDLLRSFAEDVASLQNSGVNVIIIHDGNIIINMMMDKFTLKGASENIRVTDQVSAEIVEMILSGNVNQKIVSQINQAGGYASGISGKDGQFLLARRAKIARYDYGNDNNIFNFGFLGELSLMNPDILFLLEDNNLIPVISPIAIGEDGKTYKLEAADVAAAIASIAQAQKLIILSDEPGIKNAQGQILEEIDHQQASRLIGKEPASTELYGLIKAALMAIENDIEAVHILDGKTSHVLMRELFTDELVGSTIKSSSTN